MKVKLLLLGFAFLLVSCGSTKLVRSSQKGLKGNWTLSSIATDQGNTIKLRELFNQASSDCFEGSEWSFISNNNSGKYTFQQAGCDNATHSIKWFMEENGDDIYFLWKFIPEDVNPKNVKTGFKLKLLSETETNFVLAQDASFEGENITIYYSFIRN